MKEYVEMTIEQALKLNNGNTNAKVMVAMNNLEKMKWFLSLEKQRENVKKSLNGRKQLHMIVMTL